MKYHALFVIFEKGANFAIVVCWKIIGGALRVKITQIKKNASKTGNFGNEICNLLSIQTDPSRYVFPGQPHVPLSQTALVYKHSLSIAHGRPLGLSVSNGACHNYNHKSK